MSLPVPAAATSATVAVYSTGFVAAEALTVFVGVVPGVAAHAVVLLAALNHYLFVGVQPPDAGRSVDILLLLALLPLIRILTLSIAVGEVKTAYRIGIVGVPVLAAVAMAAWLLRPPRFLARLRRWTWQQVPIALAGVPLGLVAYLIARPDPLIDVPSIELWTGVPILLVFSAVPEELLFRGLLQDAFTELFGQAGLLWASVLFAAAYLGSLQPEYVVFAGGLGLVFAVIVERTESLVGVSVAHGLLNVGVLHFWPAVLG